MKFSIFNFQFSKKKKIVLVVLALLTIFLFIFGVLPAVKTIAKAKEVYQEALKIKAAFQNQDLEGIEKNIKATQEKLLLTQRQFNYLKWSRFVPFFGKYWDDGNHLLKAGISGLEAGEILAEAIEPYADILGFKGGKAFAEMTAEERVIFVVKTLDKIAPQIDEINPKIYQACSEFKAIQPARYPQSLRGVKIREKIIFAQEMLEQIAETSSHLKPALVILPQLLGEPKEKYYLLLFQNDAELRPTGGFITAYAILKVHHGKITPLLSEDIYALDARFKKRLSPPPAIKKYLPLVYYWHLRDMNLSPDFKVSMDTFSKYYRETPGAREVDGIMAIDTRLPVELLRVLGPIGVSGWGNFSAENDPRCNCPQVIYELERLADKPVPGTRVARKAVLGSLIHSILLNIMGSPRKMWPEFFNIILKAIKEKHLLLYFFDEEVQKTAEDFNAGGRIEDYDGDYLHINDCNFAAAKSNMFIKESVEQKIEIGQNGAVIKTLTIDYKNPEPPSDCNLEKGELCLNGPYRNWFRVYVPRGSELLEANGSEIEMEVSEDLNKTVFEGFFGDKYPLRPLGSAKVILRYKLPFKVKDEYRLFIQKQPGTYGYEYTIVINGQEIDSFDLATDREIKLKM